MAKPVTLLLAIHNHQPVDNFSQVLETSYQKAYLPFARALTEHPHIRVTLHYSGFLLEWLKENHPEFIKELCSLVGKNQVELMSGGFYEPILTTLYESDKQGQMSKLTSFLRETFRTEPKGMWLAERVWEPHLAESLHNAGAKYIVIDDHHFIMAGLRGESLHGYYITEEKGKILNVFPGSERLRYLIPFHPVEETLAYLDEMRNTSETPLAIMGDDGEKFGVWPGTYHSVYEEGWLSRFFEALDENRDWIEPKLFSEVLQSHAPRGRIYLPTSSYMEMAEWSLLQNASEEFRHLKDRLAEAGLEEMARPFLAGGFWRNFFSKYPESNRMHKKMLFVSDKVHHLPDGKEKETALNELWKGQCNDAYWHGVFGGLYLPHLRAGIYRHLIRAEAIADTLLHDGRSVWLDTVHADLDKDGAEEMILNSESYTMIFAPHQGGTLIGLDFKPRSFNLQDTLTRIPEFYHQEISRALTAPQEGGVQTIHHQVMAKEEGLAERIVYDPYPRHSLIDHFFPDKTSMEAFQQGKYDEEGDFVAGAYTASLATTGKGTGLSLTRKGAVRSAQGAGRPKTVRVTKTIHATAGVSSVTIDYSIRNTGPDDLTGRFGIEFNITLLAGNAPDRYYRINGEKPVPPHLAGTGAMDGVERLVLTDEWSGIRWGITARQPAGLWRFPIETVSQSEGGFEKIYQGSCLLLHWEMRLAPGEEALLQLNMEMSDLSIRQGETTENRTETLRESP
ncbi:MAG: DUF1926 domain-containing protein [Deltaproteobacteria bacterium]|nr:DUF1926 domain-containing protein [Deltaproteobacteria bacterium]